LLTGHSDARVLSQPCEVHFAGFRSDTYRLQQAGWELSVEQDVYRRALRLAMHHRAADLYMLADSQDFDFFSHRMGDRPPVFNIRHCSSRMVIQLMESSFDFQPIDATPALATTTRRSIEDFNIFATQQVRAEEILVEPQSVAECLELIKKMQAPELAAVRKRNEQRRRDAGDTSFGSMAPLTRVHANVITLAA
jgi:hypothetical protein